MSADTTVVGPTGNSARSSKLARFAPACRPRRRRQETGRGEKVGAAERTEVSLDEFVIERDFERFLASERSAAAGLKRQSAAIAAFSVALGRIAADVLAESGR